MSINLNTNPYYDDFDQSKNYVKILFKPGLPVQARELTQIQTALQNQIAKFGNHVFQDGAVVQGGTTSFVDVNSLDVIASPAELGTIDGLRIRGVSSEATGVVVKTTTLSSSAVRIYYTKSDSKQFLATETIQVVETNENFILTNTSILESVARMFSIGESVFYVNGAFVYCEPQSIILPTDFLQNSLRVGLDVTEFTVSADADETLLDPAQGSYNFGAPGADRHAVALTLNSYYFDPREETGKTGNFIELSRFKNGRLVSKLTSTLYSEIEKTLARRTSDESGDYTVRKFMADVTENVYGEENKLSLVVSPGKAYVKGYEFETISATEIDLPKARDTQYVDGTQLSAEIGNRIIVSSVQGVIDYSNKQVDILDSGDTVIGSVIIKGIYRTITEGAYELSVYGLNLLPDYTQTHIYKLASGSWQADVDSSQFASHRNKNIVELQNRGIRTLLKDGNSDTQFVVSKTISTIFDTGVAVIATAPNEFLLSNSTDDYVVVDNAGNFFEIASVSGTATNKTITLANGAFTASAKVYTDVGVSNAIQKTKTKTTVTTSFTFDNTKRVIDTGYSDVIEVTSAIISNSSNPGAERFEYIDNFEISGGQTEYLYDHGTLALVDGATFPADYDTIEVSLSYYSHSTSGYFFSVDSYPNISYSDFPVVVDNRGVGMNMRDCLDFRPVRAQGVGNTAIVSNGVAASDTIISADYEYYLKRNDILVITSEKKFALIKGVPSETPEFPAVPDNSMLIYRLELEEYTETPANVSLTFVDNRRYTMRDIAEFDKRIKRVEYFTSLSLLEKAASDAIIASGVDGIDRFKNGILVDSFAGHDVGDTESSDYQCSIDTQTRTLRPKFKALGYGASVASTSGAVVGGTDGTRYTIPYENEVQQYNGFVTNWVNVNPYSVFTWNGTVKLTPDADKWANPSRLPADTGNVKFTDVNSFWEWWKEAGELNVGYTPWVRPRVIRFAAQMMRPDAIADALFDDVNITPYCYAATRIVCNNALPKNAISIASSGKTAEIIHANDNVIWIAYGEKSEAFVTGDALTVYVKTGDTTSAQTGFSVTDISTKETLQVDMHGDLAGFFAIPADTNLFSFRAGLLKFTLTDDPWTKRPSTSAETEYLVFSDVAGDGPKPVPELPRIKEIGCNTDISGNKAGVFEYKYNFEDTDSIIGVNVVSVSGQTKGKTPPIKVSIIWKDKAESTGFFGDLYYEKSLSALGHPALLQTAVNNVTLRRNSDAPTHAIVRVEVPFEGTSWKLRTTCAVAPALNPTYSISADTVVAANGGKFTYTVTTSDVEAGTVLYWQRDSSSTLALNDISPSSGTVTIGSTGRATFSVNISSDAVPAGSTETLKINLLTGSQTGTVVASKATTVVTPPPASYHITATPSVVGNNGVFTYNVSASNVSAGTVLYWQRDGASTASASDIDRTSGTVTLDASGRASFALNVSANAAVPGSTERLKVNLMDSGRTKLLDSVTTSITEEIVEPPATYSLSATPTITNNGGTFTYNVTATNIPNGTVLFWDRDSTSTLAAADISVSSGSVAINNGRGSFTIVVGADAVPEGIAETLKINLRTGSVAGPIVANVVTGAKHTPVQSVTVEVSLSSPNKTYKQGDTVIYDVYVALHNYQTLPNDVSFSWSIAPVSGCTTNDFVISSGGSVASSGMAPTSIGVAALPHPSQTKAYFAKVQVQIKSTAPANGVFSLGVTALGVSDSSDRVTIREKSPEVDWGKMRVLMFSNMGHEGNFSPVLYNPHTPVMAETKDMGAMTLTWDLPGVQTNAVWRVAKIECVNAACQPGGIAPGIALDKKLFRLLHSLSLSEKYGPIASPDDKLSVTPYDETEIPTTPGEARIFHFKPPAKLPMAAREDQWPAPEHSPLLTKEKPFVFGAYFNPFDGSIKTGLSIEESGGKHAPAGDMRIFMSLRVTLEYVSGDESVPAAMRTKTDTWGFFRWIRSSNIKQYDPIAQTFFVGANESPEGVFVNAVDLYFRKKSATVPIRVELRNVVNGYPAGINQPILGRAVLPANAVSTSADASGATRFVFEKITHLTPGEYALVVVSDSTDYELFSSVLGEITVDTQQRVTAQPTLGSLFKSQNASAWTPVQEEDLKFTLYRCKFDVDAPVSLTLHPQFKPEDSNITVDSIYVDSGTKTFSSSEISAKLSVNNTPATAYQLNTTKTLAAREIIDVDAEDKISMDLTLRTSNDMVAPVVDVNRAIFTLTEHLISNDFTNEDQPIDGAALAKYVTRNVTLSEGFEASDIQVLVAAKMPAGTSIKIYYKVAIPTDPVFIDNQYYEMIVDSKSSSSSTGFVEYKYKTTGTALPSGEKFDTFNVKIVMLSENPVVFPELKDLRILALD